MKDEALYLTEAILLEVKGWSQNQRKTTTHNYTQNNRPIVLYIAKMVSMSVFQVLPQLRTLTILCYLYMIDKAILGNSPDWIQCLYSPLYSSCCRLSKWPGNYELMRPAILIIFEIKGSRPKTLRIFHKPLKKKFTYFSTLVNRMCWKCIVWLKINLQILKFFAKFWHYLVLISWFRDCQYKSMFIFPGLAFPIF